MTNFITVTKLDGTLIQVNVDRIDSMHPADGTVQMNNILVVAGMEIPIKEDPKNILQFQANTIAVAAAPTTPTVVTP